MSVVSSFIRLERRVEFRFGNRGSDVIITEVSIRLITDLSRAEGDSGRLLRFGGLGLGFGGGLSWGVGASQG